MGKKEQLIDSYVAQLVTELEGSDPALIMDAANDAHEFLHSETSSLLAEDPELDPPMAVARAIESFGTPIEVAQAFLDVDGHVNRALAWPSPLRKKSLWSGIGALFSDQRAYLSLLYLLLSFITGIIYFVWAAYGLALTLGSIVLIIGIPIGLLFFGSVRAVALAESRIIEVLLGERMPRRPIFHRVEGNILTKFWVTIKDLQTWTNLCYMVIMLPLGMCYFMIVVFLFGAAVECLMVPFFPHPTDLVIVFFNVLDVTPQPWHLLFTLPASLVFLVALLSVARTLGRFHARLAKWMLVTRVAKPAQRSP